MVAMLIGGLLVALVMALPVSAGPKPCPQLTKSGGGDTLGSSGPGILNPCPGGLVWLTYFGSAQNEYGHKVGVDAIGNIYVGAFTTGGLPTTAGAYDTSFNGGSDVWVGKFDRNLTTLIWGTYLGGPGTDSPYGMAVDTNGDVYLSGKAGGGFPATSGAYDTSHNGGDDGFVARIDPTGAFLLYSSYLGGSEIDYSYGGLVLESPGIVYVTGLTYSTDFPTTPGAFDTSFNGDPAAGGDAFVSKLSLQGAGAADLVYSTFLGGTAPGDDAGRGIAVQGGYAYVVGETKSSDFPTTPDAFDQTFGGGPGADGFLVKIDHLGGGLVYATFLGGTGSDTVWDVAVDGAGLAHVTGSTDSTGFPTTLGAWDRTRSGTDAFVTKFNAVGSGLAYSTFLGGKSLDSGRGIRIAADGSAFISGYTQSSNFPVTADAYDATYNGGQDAFLTRLSAAGSGLVYSTVLGGSGEETNYGAIAIDANERVHLSGRTQSSNFPTSSGAYDTTYNGGWDGFIAALD